jgi:hypothetical protein
MSPLATAPTTRVGTRPVKATAAMCGALSPEFMMCAGFVYYPCHTHIVYADGLGNFLLPPNISTVPGG